MNNALVKKEEVYTFTTNNFKSEIEFNQETKDIYLVVYRRDDDAEIMHHNLSKEFSMLISNDAELQELYDLFNTIYKLNLGELNEIDKK